MFWRWVLALVAAAAITIVPTVIAGQYTGRWRPVADLAGAAQKIQQMPKTFGAWDYVNDGDALPEEARNELGVAGSINRTYANRKTGSVVTLLLMVGQPGRLLRHPPYICYANQANEQVGEMQRMRAETTHPVSEFNLLEYKRPQSPTDERFLVAYSLSAGQVWSVPKLLRLEFGAAQVLYKVQMITVCNPLASPDQAKQSLQQFADDFSVAFEQLNLTANNERAAGAASAITRPASTVDRQGSQ